MSDTHLRVNQQLSIPHTELQFRATRSGGPGGQHVNTSSTRVELLWDLQNSTVVDDATRDRLMRKLANRLDAEGMVRVVASESRSQQQNRAAAEERLVEIVRQALVVPKPRRKTKPSRAARERRLEEKRQHSERKKRRRRDFD